MKSKKENIQLHKRDTSLLRQIPTLKQKQRNPLKVNPELQVQFIEDPTLPLDEEDWPDCDPK